MNIPQPLVYFQYNSDFEIYRNNGYTEKQNDQAVFVGDTKKIYTHGEVFDCNNTVYNDTELRGLIGGVDDKIDSSVETLTGLIDGVNDDLDNINNWSESDIRTSINNMMSEANWINNFISTNNIQTGTPFTVTDVDNRLKAVGVLNNDGTLGWSTLQQNYNTISGTVNSLSTRVSDLETGGVDEEALQARLEGYIDDEIAGLNLDTTYARLDDTAIAWLRSGFSAQTSPQLTFAQMYSAATKDWSGDIETATAGVKTEIGNELSGYVATAELATKVENAGFAKTSGVVAKSDLDGSVAALFSSTSSTKTALDNKGYLTSSDLDGYATENYVNTAGFLTQTDLNSATATMVASSELNGKIEDYLTSSQNTSGKWAAGVNASVSTANTNASNAVSTANSANNAVSTLFATNGAGTAAITSYVNDWWSGITIAADKVSLTGKTLDAMFQNNTAQGMSSTFGLNSSTHTLTISDRASYKEDAVKISPEQISVGWWDLDEDPMTDHCVNVNSDSIEMWEYDGGVMLYLTQNALHNGSTAYPDTLPNFYAGIFDGQSTLKADYLNIGDGQQAITASSGLLTTLEFTCNGPSGFNGNITANEGITVANNKTISIGTGTTISKDAITIGNGTSGVSMSYNASQNANFSAGITPTGASFKYNNKEMVGCSASSGDITTLGQIKVKPVTGDIETVTISNSNIVVHNNYSNTTTTITASGVNQGSDRTLKDIVSDVNLTVEQVAEAPAVEFTWKNDQSENKQHNVGTIAQYWQVVLPEVVGETEDGKLTMQYSNAAMVSAIVTAKEVVALKEEIEELKRQIAELKNN